jgi:hypothetical protein
MCLMSKVYLHDNDNDAEAKERRCLMCGETFQSEWAGERICRRCRSSAAWRQG